MRNLIPAPLTVSRLANFYVCCLISRLDRIASRCTKLSQNNEPEQRPWGVTEMEPTFDFDRSHDYHNHLPT